MHPTLCHARRQRLIGAAAVVSALGLVPPAALAQTSATATTPGEGPAVEAQRRFDQARTRFEQNDFANALPEFQASLALVRSPNTRLYIGLCLARIGRVGEAYAALALAAQEAADRAPQEARYAATRDLARRELEALTPRIARLAVQVATPVAGLRVRVGNAAVPETQYGVEVPYTPGEAVVTAEAPGYATFSQVVRLGARVTSTVAVRLQPAPDATASATPGVLPEQAPVEAPVEAPTRGGGVRVAGVVLTVLGAASLGMFAYFGNDAAERYEALRSACGNRRCTASRNAEIDEGEQSQTYANVSLGVGLGAITVGAILIAVGGARTERAPAADAPTAALRWRPLIDPARGMLGVSGAF